jgi:hypothetical protein
MKAAAVVVGMVVLAFCASAAEVTFEVSVPQSTPAQAVVYVAGDFQGWRPGEAVWGLERGSDGLWRRRATFPDGQPLQFKFTLGGWSSVEKGPAGEELQNRLHVALGDTTLSLVVTGWADGSPPRASTTGDVRRLEVPGFLDGRRVWAWLPPGYDDDPARRYPVLYLLDGQNVFDAATSFAGEWEVDESLARLVAAGEVEPLIAVAVANGEGLRAQEYTPWPEPAWREATGGGGEHLRAIVEVLKPAVDRAFRTLDGPAHTGLCGSSFGGLMALHAAYARPRRLRPPGCAVAQPGLGRPRAAGHGGLATASRRAPVRRHGIARGRQPAGRRRQRRRRLPRRPARPSRSAPAPRIPRGRRPPRRRG